jgi:predicted RNase H-like HicB family nuclease
VNALDYPIQVERLSAEDGGGFAAYALDLPGCMSDGATQEEAVENVRDAIAAWIEQAQAMGRAIPPPHQISLRIIA